MDDLTAPWALRCSQCQRFIDTSYPLRLHKDEPHHWDSFTERLCGPVEKVRLRSDGDEQ